MRGAAAPDCEPRGRLAGCRDWGGLDGAAVMCILGLLHRADWGWLLSEVSLCPILRAELLRDRIQLKLNIRTRIQFSGSLERGFRIHGSTLQDVRLR